MPSRGRCGFIGLVSFRLKTNRDGAEHASFQQCADFIGKLANTGWREFAGRPQFVVRDMQPDAFPDWLRRVVLPKQNRVAAILS